MMSDLILTRDVGRPRRFRPLRALQVLLGLVFVLAGVLAFVPAFIVILLVAMTATTGEVVDNEDLVEPVVWCTLILVGGIIVWRIGARLVRGKVRTVLFLRKFHAAGPRDFVSHAASKALGRRWRLVTLDDSNFLPVSAQRWQRRTFRIAGGAGVLLAAYGIWQLYRFFDTGFDQAVDDAVADADGPVEAIGVALGSVILGVLISIFLAVLVALAVALGLSINIGSRALHNAEKDARLQIATEHELDRVVGRVDYRHRKFFSPRIAVVRVTNALWRHAVFRLAEISDVALIDISDPTDSLHWELDMLRRLPAVEIVLVGEGDRLQRLMTSPNPIDQHVLALLGASYVVVYDLDRGTFAASLRNRLARLA